MWFPTKVSSRTWWDSAKRLAGITEFVVHDCVDVVLVPFMKLRSACGHGVLGVEHGGQFLVLHFDEGESLFRRSFVHRRHGGHLVPDIPHGVLGQHVFVVSRRRDAVLRIGHVGAGEHRQDPVQRFGPGRVDALDPAMGDGGTEDLAVNHVRERDIARINGPSRHFVVGVDARDGDTDGVMLRPGRTLPFPLFFASAISVLAAVLHGAQNTGVPGAAAHVARQRFFYLFVGGIRLLFKQRGGGGDHTRRAETALYAALVHERLLQRGRFTVIRQTFHRGDGLARHFGSQ